MVRGELRHEWVARVEDLIIEIEERLAAQLTGPWLGEDFDTAKPEPIKFRRKRTFIHADFANRFLPRQASVAKSISAKLAAGRSRRWSSQCFQHVGNLW